MSKTFVFTLEREGGYTYTYEGSFESLARHISLQEVEVKIIPEHTKFNDQEQTTSPGS